MAQENLNTEETSQNKLSGIFLLAAVNWLFREAGVSEPTDRDKAIALEACRYGDVDRWVEKSYTFKQYFDRKEFEIRAFNYFMRKRLKPIKENIEAIKFFEDKMHRELAELRLLDERYFGDAFNCG